MDGATERIRAGIAVLTSTSIVPSVAIELRDGVIVGWESVPEESLSEAERATVLTPGLVNAHTHFDLGALRGAVPATEGFLHWVGELVSAREALSRDELRAGVRASAQEALRTGTTAVIDIDSMGLTAEALGNSSSALASAPRAFLLREVLDGSPAGRTARTESALQLAQVALGEGHGLSPHGTHTVGTALMADLGELVGKERVPVGVHWAETPEETQWLLHGEGPFAPWLGPSPGATGTQRLFDAGLLKEAILIHGNDPQPGEPERVAAAGCLVVHCPGCHLFFGRKRFPMKRYLSAGVRLALGTDSWASNDGLDMRREMRLARESLQLDAPTVWRMATENAASSIPDASITGTIAQGTAADLVAFRWPDRERAQDLAQRAGLALEALTLSELDVDRAWVGGRASDLG